MSEFKHRTTEAARDALSRFCTRKAPVMTIPVDNERDADMILGDVIEERDFLLLQNDELCKVSMRQQEVINGLLLSLRGIKAKLEKSHDGGCILPLRRMVNAALGEGASEKPKCICPHHSFKPDMKGCLCCGQTVGQLWNDGT
jgi:hypothetical protein